MALDLKTIVLLYFILNLVTVVALGTLWAQHRRRTPGLSLWFFDAGLQTLGLACIFLRGVIPDFVSIVVGNGATQAGAVCLLWGVQRFFRRPPRVGLNIGFLVVFLLVFSWFTLGNPDLRARDLVISAGLVWTMGQVSLVLWFGATPGVQTAARLMGSVAVAFVVTNLLRIAHHVTTPLESNDFYQAGTPESLAILAYLVLTLLLLVTQMLLVTRRLLVDVALQEEKFAKAFHSSPYAVLLSRASDGKVLELNDGFEELSGYSRAEVLGQTTLDLRIWGSPAARDGFVQRLEKDGKVRNLELPFRHKSGDSLVGLVSAEVIDFGGERCLISCIGDVTEQHRLQARLEDLATHDPLTGLPNRRLLVDRFGVAKSNAQRKQTKLAVLSLDLDHFKPVNDTRGHDVGDRVLVEAAQRLSSCLRRVDTVARFGGDEFVVLLWEVSGPGDASQVALKVLERFRQPFEVGTSIILHASVGIALYPDDGEDLETLLKKSDEALYAVKEHGRNHYRFAVLPSI